MTGGTRTTPTGSLFASRGREGGFDSEVDTERWVATILVEIDQKTINDHRNVRDRGAWVVATRAVTAASLSYNFHEARIVSADLVELERVAMRDHGPRTTLLGPRAFFRNTRLLWAAAHTIRDQTQIILRLQADRDAAELAHMRIGRDLIEQFLIALDNPGSHDEIRERLITSLGFYRDEIAVREEHV